MKKNLKDLEKGDEVYIFGLNSIAESALQGDNLEKVADTQERFDEKTGEKYKVIILSDRHKFDSRTGYALNQPTMFRIMAKRGIDNFLEEMRR